MKSTKEVADIERTARILEYDRFYTPKKEEFENPDFVYEYVFSKKVDGAQISEVVWRTRTAKECNYSKYPGELERLLSIGDIRARKRIETSYFVYLLKERYFLRFKFPNDLYVIAAPLQDSNDYYSTNHQVFIKDSIFVKDYIDQYSIPVDSLLYHRWFNSSFAKSDVGEDWRYLLNLNNPKASTPPNVLYKYFDGIVIYPPMNEAKSSQQNISKKMNFNKHFFETFNEFVRKRDSEYAEGQKSIYLILDNKVKKIQRFQLKRYLKEGWKEITLKEYTDFYKEISRKRKELAEDNIENQIAKYKGNRFKNKKGLRGSPYEVFQTITVYPKKGEEKVLASFDVKVPRYEYVEVKLKKHEYTRYNKKVCKEIKTIPVQIKITAKPTIKTIKVLQIPSKQVILLKQLNKPKEPKKGNIILPKVKYFTKIYGDDKYKKYFCEKEDVIRPTKPSEKVLEKRRKTKERLLLIDKARIETWLANKRKQA